MAVTITSATHVAYLQADGRSSVVETFTLSNGVVRQAIFLADEGLDIVAHRSATGTQILADLANTEIANNLNSISTTGSSASPTFVYSTVAANAAAIRATYSSATQAQAAFIGEFLGSLTDAQLQIAFGLTGPQVTTLRTNKLAPAATLAVSIRASVGQ